MQRRFRIKVWGKENSEKKSGEKKFEKWYKNVKIEKRFREKEVKRDV